MNINNINNNVNNIVNININNVFNNNMDDDIIIIRKRGCSRQGSSRRRARIHPQG